MLELGCLQSVSLFVLLLVQCVDGYSILQPNSYYRSCSSGYFLQITSAVYYHTACTNRKDVTSIINTNCNYNSACTIYAQNTWLGGNPCYGYTKTLEWSDSCTAIWSAWSAWTACPSDCSTQTRTRQKTCQKPNGACGTVPAESVPCKRFGCYSASDISRSTPNDNTWYNLTTDCLVASGRTGLAFRARANNDVHIAFTSVNSVTTGTAYDVVIGGWTNTRSALRFGIGGTECDYTNHSPLSQTFFDDFWVSWTGNYVRVGTGNIVGSGSNFLTCYHGTMYNVNFIWIRTGWGSSGEWRFVNDVACTHVLNTYVSVTNDDTSCNGSSTYACDSGYKQVAGNTDRSCQFGGILSGYPLVCTDSTCKVDVIFIVETSAHTSSIHSALMTVIGDLVGSLKISISDIQVGVITFNDVIVENIGLDDYDSSLSLNSAISSISIPNASSSINLAEALRVGFYDSFTLSKGNRFTAFRHFVLIAKTYSSQTDADVADHIRLNRRNQIFTIGISPPAPLVTDLKAIAGDDSRYMEYTSPSDMSTQFNPILQKIAVCPTNIIEPMVADCEMDIVFIVERYNLRYTKRFLADLMDNITVSSDGIRIGLVLFDSTASTQFRLTTHNSSEAVRGAIEAISETNQTDHLVDKGLIEARDNVFTARMGDRISASNHYVFIVGPFESYPEAVANDIRSNGSNYIYAIHIGNQYQREYQKATDSCGDYNRYTNVDSYENLITIKDDIIQKITSCQSVNITTRDCTTGETSTISVAPTLSLSTTRAFNSTSTSEAQSIWTALSPATYFTTTLSPQDKLTTKSIGLIAGVAVGLFLIGFTIGYLIKMKVIKGESSSHLSKSNQDYLFEFPDSNRIMSWKGKFNSTDLFQFNFQAV